MMKEREHTQADITKILGNGGKGPAGSARRWIVWAVLAAAAVLAVFAWGFSGGKVQVSYRFHEVQRGDLTITVSATGNLQPLNQVDVGSERSGIIRSVEVDYNDRVKVGQVLARLDTAMLQAEVKKAAAALESAQARVLQAQATLRQASAELDRMRQAHELTGGRVPSSRELDVAEAELERARADEAAARAQVSQARATLESNQTDLSKALILSPINGIVLSRNVEPGQTVAASLQAPVLFTLAEDLARMELHVDLDEADVGKVKPGQQATFTVDAYPDRIFAAEVVQVRYSAKAEAGVVTYETVLKVDNEDLLLRPGMTATADITVNEIKNAVLVPNSALRFIPRDAGNETQEKSSVLSKLMPRPPRPARRSLQNGRGSGAGRAEQTVWMLEQGALVPIRVFTGATDGIMTEILEGAVEPGMRVITGSMSIQK
ncbi:MAG TPA: efflux RND transporter periplasmic adaptor subunit [Deltaproteobacteria bacterium]|nr:efflux RND transporter periplasmic adaptor subunit [Deltaproteobacteria bacterium]